MGEAESGKGARQLEREIAKALDGVTTALIAVIVVFAAALVIGKPFGLHAYAVLSGSMEPAYSTGSLIYVKETDASQLGPGDVITYMISKDATATHRIVDEVQGEDGVTRFETKGDANDYADASLVHPDNVIGTPVLQIPMLGYVVGYVQVPPGTYVAIAACAMVVFLMFLPDLFPSRKEEEDGEGGCEESPGGAGAGRGLYSRGPQAHPATQQHIARQAHPATQQHIVRQTRPSQRQPRSAQVLPSQRQGLNATGANNPRIRNSQGSRPVQSARPVQATRAAQNTAARQATQTPQTAQPALANGGTAERKTHR